jgi:lipoate---protein ligase
VKIDIRDSHLQRINPQHPFVFELWQAPVPVVVLGSSQKPENEVHLELCRDDGVSVLKRRGGGGAVVLTAGVLCITLAFHSTTSISPYYYFKKINAFLIDTLERHFQIEGMNAAGISDIAIGERKILGCSMFKSKQNFLYQGSLLVNPDLSSIYKYIKHPSKEPDYRNGRPHEQFLTSLEKAGYPLVPKQVQVVIEHELTRNFFVIIS